MSIKHRLFIALILLAIPFWTGCKHASSTQSFSSASLYQDLPFEMGVVPRPTIPDRTFSVTEFGGVGDGYTLNTKAFADAIVHLNAQGGGRLEVPQGVWLTGPISLENNIELHIAQGAMLVFSTDKSAYPLVETIFEGLNTYRCQSPISAFDKQNVAITGSGIIDGSGDAWRAVKSDKVAPSQWKTLVKSGGLLSDDGNTWYPSESFRLGAGDADQNVSNWAKTKADFESIRDFLRPVMISFVRCKNVLLDGPTFQNSPCWNIHPVLCENLIVNDITVRCPWYAQNGDGIDIESCTNVVLTNSSFDVGDDGICIKSGKNEQGRLRGVPCSNVIVDNCTVFHGHGGFVVGSEMSGGVKNVMVRNCRFSGTDVGLRFKSTRGRGGVVEGIYIRDITMNDILTEALLFDLFYGGKSAVEALADGDGNPTTDLPALPVDETTPQFKDIHIANVQCHGARRAMLFNGLPEMNVEHITVEDCAIHAQIGAQLNESKDIQLHRVRIFPEEGPALMINNVKDMTVTDFYCPPGQEPSFTATGSRNARISITSSSMGDVEL